MQSLDVIGFAKETYESLKPESPKILGYIKDKGTSLSSNEISNGTGIHYDIAAYNLHLMANAHILVEPEDDKYRINKEVAEHLLEKK